MQRMMSSRVLFGVVCAGCCAIAQAQVQLGSVSVEIGPWTYHVLLQEDGVTGDVVAIRSPSATVGNNLVVVHFTDPGVDGQPWAALSFDTSDHISGIASLCEMLTIGEEVRFALLDSAELVVTEETEIQLFTAEPLEVGVLLSDPMRSVVLQMAEPQEFVQDLEGIGWAAAGENQLQGGQAVSMEPIHLTLRELVDVNLTMEALGRPGLLEGQGGLAALDDAVAHAQLQSQTCKRKVYTYTPTNSYTCTTSWTLRRALCPPFTWLVDHDGCLCEYERLVGWTQRRAYLCIDTNCQTASGEQQRSRSCYQSTSDLISDYSCPSAPSSPPGECRVTLQIFGMPEKCQSGWSSWHPPLPKPPC